MPSRLDLPALDRVLRTLAADRLPHHTEVALSRASGASGAFAVRLLDNACDLYATTEIGRFELLAYGGDARVVTLLARTLTDLVQRLASAREGAVRQALAAALGDLAAGTEIRVGGAGRVNLLHTSGAHLERDLAAVPGGLPAWAAAFVREYRYRITGEGGATVASLSGVLRSLYLDPAVPGGRAYALDTSAWIVNHDDYTGRNDLAVAARLRRMLAAGGYSPPSPLDDLQHHTEVATRLIAEVDAEGARLLRRYALECQRLLRSEPCAHAWGNTVWAEHRSEYHQSCATCGALSAVKHHHTEARGVHPVEGYGEVDLDCKRCWLDGTSVEGVRAVFRAATPARYARTIDPSSRVEPTAAREGWSRHLREVELYAAGEASAVLHGWTTLEELAADFEGGADLAGFEVLYGCYERDGYEGDCFVLLRSLDDGELYEASSSHCSCNGLAWAPERTTVEALLTQPRIDRFEGLRVVLAATYALAPPEGPDRRLSRYHREEAA